MNFFYSKFKLNIMKDNFLYSNLLKAEDSVENNFNYKVKMFEEFNNYFYLVYSDINKQLGKLEEIFKIEAEKAKLIADKEKEAEKDNILNDLINFNKLSFKSKLLLKIDREKEVELKDRFFSEESLNNNLTDSLQENNFLDNNYQFNIFSSSQPEDHL